MATIIGVIFLLLAIVFWKRVLLIIGAYIVSALIGLFFSALFGQSVGSIISVLIFLPYLVWIVTMPREKLDGIYDKEAGVNAKDADGYTPFAGGDMGAGVNAKDARGGTALHFAAWEGDTAAVQALLAAGADVNARGADDETALHIAVRKNRTKTVQALLAAAANVNARNAKFWTALHIASAIGYAETARALVAAGADINARDADGRTALDIAAEWGRTETFEVLSELSSSTVDRTSTDNLGDTSLSGQTVSDGQKSKDAEKSKTRVNEASLDELLHLPGIGAAEANMIVRRRDEKPFSSIVELVDFLELKPHFATRLEELIDFYSEAPDKDENVDAQEGQTPPGTATHGSRVID